VGLYSHRINFSCFNRADGNHVPTFCRLHRCALIASMLASDPDSSLYRFATASAIMAARPMLRPASRSSRRLDGIRLDSRRHKASRDPMDDTRVGPSPSDRPCRSQAHQDQARNPHLPPLGRTPPSLEGPKEVEDGLLIRRREPLEIRYDRIGFRRRKSRCFW